MFRRWWLNNNACFEPEGGNGNGGTPAPSGPAGWTGPSGAPAGGGGGDYDVPADPGQESGFGGQDFSYIDEATHHMLQEDGNEQPFQPQPQYPQPVVPGARRAPAQPGQRPAANPQLRQLAPGQQPAAPQAPVAQPPPQATPQAQPSAPQSLTPAEQEAEDIRRDPFAYQSRIMQQQEAAFIDTLAKETYAISNEDMDAFLSGDASKVSQALARVHVNSVNSVMRCVSQYMPMWVGNMINVHRAAQEAEDGFWSANPGLNKAQHGAYAKSAATAFRQMNPQATREDMYRMVGAMVAAAAGVQNTFRAPGQAATHALPNGVRTPGPVVRNTGSAFQPAGVQTRTGVRAPQPSNPWDVASQIIQADDAGMFDNQM